MNTEIAHNFDNAVNAKLPDFSKLPVKLKSWNIK